MAEVLEHVVEVGWGEVAEGGHFGVEMEVIAGMGFEYLLTFDLGIIIRRVIISMRRVMFISDSNKHYLMCESYNCPIANVKPYLIVKQIIGINNSHQPID